MIEYYHYDMGHRFRDVCEDYVVDLNHITRWAFPRRFCLVIKYHKDGRREHVYADDLGWISHYYEFYRKKNRRCKNKPYTLLVLAKIGRDVDYLKESTDFRDEPLTFEEADEIMERYKEYPQPIAEDRSLVKDGVRPHATSFPPY